MEVVCSFPDTLAKILKSFHDFSIQDVNLLFTEKGLKIQSMDPSHTTLIELCASKATFDEYSVDDDFVIGVRLMSIAKILESVPSSTVVHFNLRKGVFYIVFNTGVEHRFEIPLMEIPNDLVSCNGFTFKKTMSVLNGRFKDLIHNLSLIEANRCYFHVSNHSMEITSCGDLGKSSIRLTDDTEEYSLVNADPDQDIEDFTVGMSLEKLRLAIIPKFNSRSSKHFKQIFLGEDAPLLFKYRLSDHIQLSYYFSPLEMDDG